MGVLLKNFRRVLLVKKKKSSFSWKGRRNKRWKIRKFKMMNKLSRKSIAPNLQFDSLHYASSSIWYSKFMCVGARNGAHKAFRCNVEKLSRLLRIRYFIWPYQVFLQHLKLLRCALATRLIIRRRFSYEKIGIILPGRQWKIAIKRFFDNIRVEHFSSFSLRFQQFLLSMSAKSGTRSFYNHIYSVARRAPTIRYKLRRFG